MEALIALIIGNISKFLNYLNINVRLQNKIITVISVFPTLYILRIVRGYFSNGFYLKGTLFLIIFLVLAYFIVLNFIYYFKDRKVKWDVTNFIEDIVPEDVTFTGDGLTTTGTNSGSIQGKSVKLDFVEDSPIIIETIIRELIEKDILTPQDLEVHNYLIEKYALIPFYKIRHQSLYIGSSYEDMVIVATIEDLEEQDSLTPLGVFILGGTYQIDGITYKEPYTIELRVKDSKESTPGELPSRSRRKKA